MLGKRIRLLRVERGISLSQRAARLGKNRYWMREVEWDLQLPKGPDLIRMTQVLEVTLSDLTDSFRLDVAVEFSWRPQPAENPNLLTAVAKPESTLRRYGDGISHARL